jgi:LPS export ABC transporter protein LptC
MRTSLRRLVVALIVVVSAMGVFLLGKTLYLQHQADLRREVLDVLPQVAQRIQDFHRTRVVNGRKVWEVSAREAQYHDEEHMAVVSAPSVAFFMEDGRQVALRGDEGKVYLDGKDLARVDLHGGVEVNFGTYALHTDLVSYERKNNVIVAPGKVRISGEEFDIRGDELNIQLSAQQLRVEGNVQMTLRPGA